MLCAIKPRWGDILVFVYCSANEFFINDALNRYITPKGVLFTVVYFAPFGGYQYIAPTELKNKYLLSHLLKGFHFLFSFYVFFLRRDFIVPQGQTIIRKKPKLESSSVGAAYLQIDNRSPLRGSIHPVIIF